MVALAGSVILAWDIFDRSTDNIVLGHLYKITNTTADQTLENKNISLYRQCRVAR